MPMNSKAKILLIIITIVYTNSAFAIDKEAINLENTPTVFNTEKNIEQAKFIEDEVVLFKDKLLVLQKNYLLDKDPIILNSLKDIQEIIYILRKIQTTKVNKATADNVITIVINDLKNINTITKNHLRNTKDIFLEKRKKYDTLGETLAINLEKIVWWLTIHYSKQTSIDDKWKRILLELQSLQKKSIQLKNFKNVDFKNIDETKAAFIRILQGVKTNIIQIKTISKEK